jgi:hypothetical protein
MTPVPAGPRTWHSTPRIRWPPDDSLDFRDLEAYCYVVGKLAFGIDRPHPSPRTAPRTLSMCVAPSAQPRAIAPGIAIVPDTGWGAILSLMACRPGGRRREPPCKIHGTEPSKPLESTTGRIRVAQGSYSRPCGCSRLVQMRVATASVFSRRGRSIWAQETRDDLKEAAAGLGIRSLRYLWGGSGARIMDCLTEQSQFLLKTKDLSRNKPKQSQKTKPIVPFNSLIPLKITDFRPMGARNVNKTNALIKCSNKRRKFVSFFHSPA